jgi:triosephosphate isomerase
MTFYFGSNLKMNLVPAETRSFVSQLDAWLARPHSLSRSVQLWVAPSSTNLLVACQARQDARLWIGAQNVHWNEAGAHTGEISARQVKACGADFVLLGHAERRLQFGETDEQINLKVRACERHDLRVMVCVGETKEAHGAGTGMPYVSAQLERALTGFDRPESLVVLYEPVWSVGAGGSAADPVYVNRALENIRRSLERHYAQNGRSVPILYGGSVNVENAASYAGLATCAGLGVGRAAWQAAAFISVLESCLSPEESLA